MIEASRSNHIEWMREMASYRFSHILTSEATKKQVIAVYLRVRNGELVFLRREVEFLLDTLADITLKKFGHMDLEETAVDSNSRFSRLPLHGNARSEFEIISADMTTGAKTFLKSQVEFIIRQIEEISRINANDYKLHTSLTKTVPDPHQFFSDGTVDCCMNQDSLFHGSTDGGR